MKLIDVAARNAKELESIKRKIKAYVKENAGKSCNMGDLDFFEEGAVHGVQLDNDGEVGKDYISDIIRKSPNAVVISTEEHKGSYDWSADVYIRPCSIVRFKFV